MHIKIPTTPTLAYADPNNNLDTPPPLYIHHLILDALRPIHCLGVTCNSSGEVYWLSLFLPWIVAFEQQARHRSLLPWYRSAALGSLCDSQSFSDTPCIVVGLLSLAIQHLAARLSVVHLTAAGAYHRFLQVDSYSSLPCSLDLLLAYFRRKLDKRRQTPPGPCYLLASTGICGCTYSRGTIETNLILTDYRLTFVCRYCDPCMHLICLQCHTKHESCCSPLTCQRSAPELTELKVVGSHSSANGRLDSLFPARLFGCHFHLPQTVINVPSLDHALRTTLLVPQFVPTESYSHPSDSESTSIPSH